MAQRWKKRELIANRKERDRHDAEGKKAQLLYNLQFKLWISNRNTEIRGTFNQIWRNQMYNPRQCSEREEASRSSPVQTRTYFIEKHKATQRQK
ncbi:hypothetical protein L3X38_040888 [Prunus dulcis]|uniref:Uncharacterized protein n=1 Tax=Prunus dulcis TaxID=3755 RepID=A0AAD4UR61_PRUDU|nr:hypothetical protein L3X38_040888 [Prunus dulcis]